MYIATQPNSYCYVHSYQTRALRSPRSGIPSDIIFYCIHNQLWMPQYKVNVQDEKVCKVVSYTEIVFAHSIFRTRFLTHSCMYFRLFFLLLCTLHCNVFAENISWDGWILGGAHCSEWQKMFRNSSHPNPHAKCKKKFQSPFFQKKLFFIFYFYIFPPF